MPSSGLGAYQVKIHQIVFGGLFFLVVLMGVRAMMAGGAWCSCHERSRHQSASRERR